MHKYYAGIGARSTPDQILQHMESIATKLSGMGYVLRSGGAQGADTAFENGANRAHYRTAPEIFRANDATFEAIEIASRHHPAWDKCNDYVRKLHGRNVMILLGEDLLDPVEFVVCWTPDGKDSGGTGLGIRVAKTFDIKVNNLHNEEVLNKTLKWLRG